MKNKIEQGWPGEGAIKAFQTERATPEGRNAIRERIESAVKAYYRTVRNEVPPRQRPEFQLPQN